MQRQLAELMDDGGGRNVHMAAQQRQAKDRRGRFGDAQELRRTVEVGQRDQVDPGRLRRLPDQGCPPGRPTPPQA
jgi:hypothetical protein